MNTFEKTLTGLIVGAACTAVAYRFLKELEVAHSTKRITKVEEKPEHDPMDNTIVLDKNLFDELPQDIQEKILKHMDQKRQTLTLTH